MISVPRTAGVSPPAAAGGADTLPFYRGIYDRLYSWGYHRDPDYSHARRIAQRLQDSLEFESVLDVGCSHGWALEFFARHGKRAVGVDVSARAIRSGRRLGRDVREASATALPFPDRSFDLVISTDCFEHLRPQDVDAAVKEARRVAAKYLAFTIAVAPDQAWHWRLLALRPLHLTVRPLDWWIERLLAEGGRLMDREDIAFTIAL